MPKILQRQVLLEEIKRNIIIKEGIFYFDWTASGLGYKPIESEICDILTTYANTHSECGKCAQITTNYYENAKNGLKKLLGLDDSFYLIPCGFGSTAAIKKFQEIMGIYIPPKTREILRENIKNIDKKSLPLVIIGPFEHHSNEISYRYGLCELVRIGLTKDGNIDYAELERVLKNNAGRRIIASFSAASNVTGILADTENLHKMVAKFGGILAFDASSNAAYQNINCDHFDALFISSHKLLGGVGGCGLLAIKKSLYTQSEPTFAGGGVVSYVSRKSVKFIKDVENLEVAGTPPITQLIRAFLAFKLRNDIGLEKIAKIEAQNLAYFENGLKNFENLICYCPKNLPRAPIFALNIKGISPYILAKILSEKFGVQTRAGCACAGPYGHELLGLRDDEIFSQKPGFLRISLHYTHTKDELDYLLSALAQSVKFAK